MRRSYCVIVGLVLLLAATVAPSALAATVAYYRFEEGAVNAAASGNGSILDSSSNGLHGSPINGPIYRADVPANPVPLTQAANFRSLDFNGTSQRVFIPDNSLFQLTHSLTIEAYAFIRTAPAGDARYIVFRGDDRNNFDPYWLGVGTGQIAFAIDTAAGVRTMLSTPVPAFNQWLHIAGTLDDANGEMKLYVDSVLKASTTTANRSFAVLDANQNPGLGIGNVQSSNFTDWFDGLIDEVRISDQALPTSQFLNAVPEPVLGSIVASIPLITLRRRRVTGLGRRESREQRCIREGA